MRVETKLVICIAQSLYCTDRNVRATSLKNLPKVQNLPKVLSLVIARQPD